MTVNRGAVIRKLAAILIADVVGFSRHMERDEDAAFERLRGIRVRIVDPKIAEHGGRVVKTAGDGMLLEFGSADAALRCAIDVQRAMHADNESKPSDQRIEFRIGINLGDIIVDGTDIAGDGVNVAARLEALAEPGGICVSAAVREQVHGSLDVGFDDIGEQQVKNIMRPIRVFAVALEAATAHGSATGHAAGAASQARPITSTMRQRSPLATSPAWVAAVGVMALVIAGSAFVWWNSRGKSPPTPPSISVGVMPLVAPPGDAAAVQRAATLTRDLATLLVRTDVKITAVLVPMSNAGVEGRGIDATARAVNVRYLLEGDLRPRPDAAQVNLRLIDGSTNAQIWGETVSLKETDPSDVQRRAMRAAIEHLYESLNDVEMRRAMALPPGGATPMDYVLRARALGRTLPDTLQRAREQQKLYEEALRRDPNLVAALTGLTGALDKQNDNDFDIDHERFVQRIDDVTAKAVHLNGSSPETWDARAMALTYMGQWNGALEASARAIQLDPDAAWPINNRAWLMSMSGRLAEALTLLEQAVAMDPPGGWTVMRYRCEAYLLLGQYEPAIAACEKAKGLSREDWLVDSFLAAAYAHKGDTARAAAAKAEVLRRVPGYTIAMLKSRGYSLNPDYIRLAEEQWYSGLRKAGFPEQ
jgi:adenylate cyclase